MDDPTLMSIQATCTGISMIACFFTAIILFILKRKSKIHYRLEIGLCFAFGTTNLCDFVLAFVGWHVNDATHRMYLIEQVLIRAHIFFFSTSVHYIIMMYVNYLLQSLGKTEQMLYPREKWMHFWAWCASVTFVFIFSFVENNNTVTTILIAVFAVHATFILICTLCIFFQQRKNYNINSEVLSPLISPQTKSALTGFLARLVFLTILTLLIYAQAFIFATQIIWKYLRQSDITLVSHFVALVSLCGTLISILLATTPELIKVYKKKYLECIEGELDYQAMLPPSPYIASSGGSAKRLAIPKRQVSVSRSPPVVL